MILDAAFFYTHSPTYKNTKNPDNHMVIRIFRTPVENRTRIYGLGNRYSIR